MANQMANTRDKFISGLIASLKSDYAQGRINEAITSEAQLSRVFDEFKLSNKTNVALYKEMIESAGQDALTIELDETESQESLSIKVNKELRLVAEDIIKELLATHGLCLKQEVKLAMGDNYVKLEKKIGEEKIMRMLLQAALVSYAQATTAGCASELGIVTSINGGAKDATHEQLDTMKRFAENIGMKMNRFASIVEVDYIKLTSLNNALDNAISHLTKYRAGFDSGSSASQNHPNKIDDITDALNDLVSLKEKLNNGLKEMDEKGDYSTAKELCKQCATEVAGIIKEKILDKPSLAQLHGFFEHLLNVIIITFTLGYRNYIPPAKLAIEPLEDYGHPTLDS